MRRIPVILLIISLLVTLSGCGQAPDSEIQRKPPTRIVTDMLGRKVEIPTKINSLICTGAGTLRMVTYLGAQDLVSGVEDTDQAQNIKRPYNFAYHELFKDLPSVGKGGGRGYTAYAEEIILLQPDVIFSSYTGDALEELASKTGIPVIYVAYNSNSFVDELPEALTLMGDILERQERAADLLAYLESSIKDLNKRTAEIPQVSKPKAYTGAVTFSGGHGFGGTYSDFPPFNFINAINVADVSKISGSFEVDWEKVLVWDPDYIFLDPGNLNLVNEEYAKNPDYFHSLRAVREDRVYSLVSYNNYTTNIEIALANAYYAGKVLFPGEFTDIEIEAKVDELLEKFLGKAFYTQMKGAGLAFGQISIGR
jgi:iron complex transport system substrate-binding protein